MKIEIKDKLDFFVKSLHMANVAMRAEDQLAKKEIMFLAIACDMNDRGISPSDNSKLCHEIITVRGLLKTPHDVAVYKSKLAAKRWIKGGWHEFKTPKNFFKKDKMGRMISAPSTFIYEEK